MTEYFGEFEPAQLRYVQQPFVHCDDSSEDGSDNRYPDDFGRDVH
jgi:hypothetical protein